MMGNGDVEIRVVVNDESAATELQGALEPLASSPPLVLDEFGIDGAAASGLIVLATATIQAVPAVLDALKRHAGRGEVGEIIVSEGDIRVVQPRAQDVDRIIELWSTERAHGLGNSQ